MFFYSFFKAFKFVEIRIMNFFTPIQLTFGSYGHTLHHCQVVSPDNQWVVYDTRNEDTAIGTTTRIERVHLSTLETEVLYEVQNPNEFGPGVGAVTYAPHKEMVLFIHGLMNANEHKPYAMDRRSGVGIDLLNKNLPIHFDARKVSKPYIQGALRGGTHSHCWHSSGDLISFTYNDEVLSTERMVGVMFPKSVDVYPEDAENFSGTHYAAIVSQITSNASPGSDEIEKAFDECWLGKSRILAFQGWVRDYAGNRKTEIFTIDLNDIENCVDRFDEKSLSFGSLNPPQGIFQKRVTRTLKGVSSFRHWLRSSPDGLYVYFMMENEDDVRNIYRVQRFNETVEQITFHEKSIDSPFNISSDGHRLVYFCDHSLIVYDMIKRSFKCLIADEIGLYGIPNFDQNDEFILFNQYVHENLTSKFLQIFKIRL